MQQSIKDNLSREITGAVEDAGALTAWFKAEPGACFSASVLKWELLWLQECCEELWTCWNQSCAGVVERSIAIWKAGLGGIFILLYYTSEFTTGYAVPITRFTEDYLWSSCCQSRYKKGPEKYFCFGRCFIRSSLSNIILVKEQS